MKFSYNWIREFVDGLDVPAEALERLITMKTAECEGVETVGALLADAVAGDGRKRRADRRQHNVKAVVDAGRYGRKTVVCGAPNCRRRMRTVYVPLGVKIDLRRRERRHAGQRRRARHQSRSQRHYRTARRRGHSRSPTASSRSTTRASRIGPISGAITAWRAKWPRSPARRCAIRFDARTLLPAARQPGEDRDRRSGAVPALQRAGFRERHACSLRRSGCRRG